MKILFPPVTFIILVSLAFVNKPRFVSGNKISVNDSGSVQLMLLGTIQDGGSPHIGCKKECCRNLFLNPDSHRKVVSIGLSDSQNKKDFIIEASPDFTTQLKYLKQNCGYDAGEFPDAIFLTHAHIGHYTGLMYLGKEAAGSKNIPVYAMPRMKTFLEQNGPWNQLVQLQNIQLISLQNNQPITATPSLKITPFKVPHRDEYSETVGYLIEGLHKKALFIPDIDKWEKWDSDIVSIIKKVDYAFIDGTFYDGNEISNRNISEIPHPFIIESMEKFKDLPSHEKSKIYFIHFNHTNPVIDTNSAQAKLVIEKGFNLARFNQAFKL